MTDYIETSDENELRSHIFQVDDREELLINVPEWNTQLLLRSLSGVARTEYLAFQLALEKHHKDTPEYWKRLWFELVLLACVHPVTKKPVFKPADRDTLMTEKNGDVVETIGRTVQIFCKLDGSIGTQVAKNLSGILSSTTITSSSNDSDETTGE